MSKEQKTVVARLIVAAVFFAAALITDIIFSPEFLWGLLLFLPAYIIIGYDVIKEAAENIIHGEIFDECFLMTVATVGAFIIGEFAEAVAVMLFYKAGEFFEDLAVEKSRKNIAELMSVRPDKARVLRNGEWTEVSPEEVKIGETVAVFPGERIPLDGIVTGGISSVDTSSLTGESLPVTLKEGLKAISGTVATDGKLEIKVTSVSSESTVSKILSLVENAASKKAKTEKFITRFAKIYTPAVVVTALVIGILIPLIFGDFYEWISRALIFLVVSCPCALVVSVPLTFFAGIGAAAKNGILVKGSEYFEILANVKKAVFDKTGTLTKGSFSVEAVHPTEISEAELTKIAAAAESRSSHPIARSLSSVYTEKIPEDKIGDVTEIAGKGIKVTVDGKQIYVGNELMMEEIGADWHPCHLTGTVIHIAEENKYYGHIVVSDEIKPETAAAVEELHSLGVSTAMLTGDRTEIAADIAKKAGIDEFRAGLLPDGKVEAIDEFIKEDGFTVFAGDGINDAPVISRADAGIAMGALGSDAAVESADVVITDDDLRKIPLAVRISRKTVKIARQNIIFAVFVKFAVLLLAAFGILSAKATGMWIAVFADVGVMMLAVINALRAFGISKS